ncbi:hypothetical protein [Burkholderia stagnalis]|nr:hypothetical protein [Burkholderia stagnalis]
MNTEQRRQRVAAVMARVVCTERDARVALQLHDWNVHDAIVYIRNKRAA